MRKYLLSVIIVILGLTGILSALVALNLTATVHAAENEIEQDHLKNEERDRSFLSREVDFEDDCIVVVLDAKISKVNKIHSTNFFGGIKIKLIKDLTERKINMRSKNDFRQILKITLKDKSKEKAE